jgi:hypothetical protein
MPEMTVRSSTRGFPGLPCGRWGFNVFHASSDSQNRFLAMPHLQRLKLGQKYIMESMLCMGSQPSKLCKNSFPVPAHAGKKHTARHAEILETWFRRRTRSPPFPGASEKLFPLSGEESGNFFPARSLSGCHAASHSFCQMSQCMDLGPGGSEFTQGKTARSRPSTAPSRACR